MELVLAMGICAIVLAAINAVFFYVGNLKPSDKSAQELRDMGMLDMNVYTQLQAADAMRDAAFDQRRSVRRFQGWRRDQSRPESECEYRTLYDDRRAS